MIEKLERVVSMLKSDSHELQYLVKLSGRDAFRFFNGADLTGLDLSSQNLSGMNFDGADLRFSNLSSISFDPGCFNLSVLDRNQQWLRDEYEFNAEEIINFPARDLLVFVKFRAGLMDAIISMLGISLENFSVHAGISTSSLRKARANKVVAIETSQSIIAGCRKLFFQDKREPLKKYISLIEQPCAALLVGGNNKPFETISHQRLEHLLLLRRLRLKDSELRHGGSVPAYLQHRDTAEYLRYFEDLVNRVDLYE
ncbi:Pentapeptide repeat-containing protein [Sphingomonas sp. OV641]|uniref:pentapeptide repeat-containing protein n=1 Tax=Sphingomonas sp. OV641 TaxID=1881068 RepID=UPI0008BEF4AE|nr:pentapeptide repeat-containing protein [Sphingomonas sp. OV641]SEI86260.1 Pentapeptide repeat-containing protein [Sphingomonas sp. OV641]